MQSIGTFGTLQNFIYFGSFSSKVPCVGHQITRRLKEKKFKTRRRCLIYFVLLLFSCCMLIIKLHKDEVKCVCACARRTVSFVIWDIVLNVYSSSDLKKKKKKKTFVLCFMFVFVLFYIRLWINFLDLTWERVCICEKFPKNICMCLY